MTEPPRFAPRRPEDFDALYEGGCPPWDIGRPQSAFLRLAAEGAFRGRVLDAGCGTGEHVLLAASMGLDATGVDTAAAAIARAEAKARDRGLTVRFLVWNALDLAGLGERFDTVVDSGLFHVFDDEDRSRYVRTLASVLEPGGRYHLLCFSDRQPGEMGPRRVSRAEIRSSFHDGWRVDAIEPATFETPFGPDAGAAAWLASITRADV